MKKPILDVEGLSKYFLTKQGANQAVNNVSFRLYPGEVLGLVGQSGSGKSTIARSIMRLIKDTNGVVLLDQKVVSGKINKRRLGFFRQNVQMIFQDPSTSLNERQNVFSIIVEPLKSNGVLKRWTKEFLAGYDDLIQTFELTFKEKFLRTQLELIQLSNRLITRAYKKADENLTNLFHDETINVNSSLFTELILQYFGPIHEANNQVTLAMNSAIKDLTSFYEHAKKRVAMRDLPKDEVDLINTQQALEEYKNSFKKSKAYQNYHQIKTRANNEFSAKVEQTNQILKAFRQSYVKKIKFLKEMAFYTRTDQDYQIKMQEITRMKFLINLISNFINKHFVVDPETLLVFEKQLNSKKPRNWNEFVKQYAQHFAHETSLNRSQTLAMIAKAKQTYDQVRNHSSQISSQKISLLQRDFAKAQTLFLGEKKVYQAKFNQIYQELIREIEVAKNTARKINQSRLKSQLEIKFKSYFNKMLVTIKNPRRRAMMNKVVSDNFEQLKIARFNQSNAWKLLDEIAYIFAIKRTPFLYHKVYRMLMKKHVYDALIQVGLKSDDAYRYPHEFSGGQKQRINIARALIMKPKVIIADEPIASLDVSIQAQVVNILVDLVREQKISMIFISHDLQIVEYIADSILVMHEGRIVEKGLVEPVFKLPVHPYTRILFEAIPRVTEPNQPFKFLEAGLSYINEYNLMEPKMQKVEEHHYVLANEKQFVLWLEEAKANEDEQTNKLNGEETENPREVFEVSIPESGDEEEIELIKNVKTFELDDEITPTQTMEIKRLNKDEEVIEHLEIKEIERARVFISDDDLSPIDELNDAHDIEPLDSEITPNDEEIQPLTDRDVVEKEDEDNADDYNEYEDEIVPIPEPIENIKKHSHSSTKAIDIPLRYDEDDDETITRTFYAAKHHRAKPEPRVFKSSINEIRNELWLEKGVLSKSMFARWKNKFKAYRQKTKKMRPRNG